MEFLKDYKKLVLAGGSAKGLAYISVLRYFEENKMVFDDYICTSIGALFGLFMVLGYTSKELKEALLDFKFELTKNSSISNLLENFGLTDGKHIEKIIKVFIKNKGLNPEITMKDLYTETKKNFVCTVCNINTKQTEFFNHISMPDLPVYLAVRASANIPFLIAPIKIKDSLYVDGGVSCNMGCSYFNSEDTGSILCMTFKDIFQHNHIQIDSLDSYFYNTLKSALNSVEKRDIEYALKNGYEVVSLNIEIENSIDFNMERKAKEKIIETGYKCISSHFEKKTKELI